MSLAIRPRYDEHSTGGGAGQACPSTAGLPHSLRDRYGCAIDHGFTAIPNVLLDHQATLGLSDVALVILIKLLAAWRPPELPHLSIATMATTMGKSVRQVQVILRHLQAAGLIVIRPRLAANGAQLENYYDLQPLLERLHALADSAPDRTPPVQALAPAPPRPAAGAHKDDLQKHEKGIGSSPIAQRQIPSTQERETCHAAPHEPFVVHVAAVCDDLGDLAPDASLTRAYRLIETCGYAADTVHELIDHAHQVARAALPTVRHRGAHGGPNAMPYFFAVFGRLLRAPDCPTPDRRAAAPPPLPHSTDSPPPSPVAGHADWPRLRSALAEVLAPSMMRRIGSLETRTGRDDALEVVVPNQFMCEWIKRLWWRHLQHAIADLDHALVTRIVCEPGG